MIATTRVRTWELERTPDLIDVVSAARDSGHEGLLVERPMPEAVSVAGLGRAFDIVAAPGGVAVEDPNGEVVDFDPGTQRLLAAARMWRRLSASRAAGAAGVNPVAVGGFAYRPDRDPRGPWSGFPALLLRVPALALVRSRGRTFATAAGADAAELLDLAPRTPGVPAARTLQVTPIRNPVSLTPAVVTAPARHRPRRAPNARPAPRV